MTTSPNSPREHEASIFSRSPSPLPVLLALAIAIFLLAISLYCSSSLTFNYFYQKTLPQSTSRSYTSQYWLQVVLIIVVLFGVIISWLSFKNRARGSNFYEDGGNKLWWRSWSPQVGWFRSEVAPSHTLAAAEVADHVPPCCSPLQALPASELLSRRQSREAPLLALPAPPSPSSSVVPMPSLSSSLVPSGLSLPTSSPPASSPTQNSSPSRAASSPPPAHSYPSALATAPATLTTC